jgi:hypothetical protein
MLVLTIQSEMPLAEPNEEFGFVTWLDVSIRQFDASTREPIGHARIAVIQVADAMNRGVEIREVLSSESELFGLYDVFFDPAEYLKAEYANGVGFNVIYFADIELRPAWRGKRIEQALVQRVTDTWGEGCAIAVVSVAEQLAGWREVGFQSPGPASRYAFLDLSLAHAGLVAADEQGHAFALHGE